MSNPLLKERDCTHPTRDGVHEEYCRPNGSSFCRACGVEIDPPVFGWIVGSSERTQWRRWDGGFPIWVYDREQATRYHRREDAEAVHAEDDDAWVIVPYKTEGQGDAS